MKNLRKISSLILGICLVFFQIPLSPTIQTNIVNAATTEISTNYFTEIKLNAPLPLTYYKNEVYIIKGTVSYIKDGHVTAILESKDKKTKKTFTESLSGAYFEIPLYFKDTGTFNLGILNGESGRSNATEISVTESLPVSKTKTTAPAQPSSLDINFRAEKTIVRLPVLEPSLKEITFSQDDKKVTYFCRQNERSIPINYSDFKGFQKKSATVSIRTAYIKQENPLSVTSDFSSPTYKEFAAIQHEFSEISTDEISATIPYKLSSPAKFSISGKAINQLSLNAFVINPNGLVDEITLTGNKKTTVSGKEVIDKNSNFTLTYTPTKKDTYIVEINNKDSIPVVNSPIYIGKGIPLIPDFFDLNERTLFTDKFDLTLLRNELLADINASRKEYGLESVKSSTELNKLAQGHSDDMSKNGYFGHINKAGQTPNDRRISAEIKTPVSENIAKDTSIEFAHAGLMRSASHRINILGKDWARVGIGITAKDGYLFITEEFSTDELSQSQLDKKETELLSSVNKLRKDKKLNEISENSSLKSAANYANSKMIKNNTSISNFSNSMLTESLKSYNVSGSVIAIGRNYYFWSDILSSIMEQNKDTILQKDLKDIGIDIQIDKNANIQVIIYLRKL